MKKKVKLQIYTASTDYFITTITIDVDKISRLPEQRRVSLKIHDYLAAHYGWEF